MLAVAAMLRPPSRIPDRLVVLTFDDAVKSHRTVVAPLLHELGFQATFFVTHRWMDDPEYFMSWQDIAGIHQMGFEIGNHSWTHGDFSVPRNAARLAGELALVEGELKKAGVPRPVSFAYSGNFFGPEALAVLEKAGYRWARRGEMPEQEYGKVIVGPAYDPARHHPLLIPTTGDAYPDWTFEHFQKVAAEARDGRIVVFQFHGVPDIKHPWVHTPPESFRRYMKYLKDNNFVTLAMRDLESYIDRSTSPADPMLVKRYREPKDGVLRLPVEMEASRREMNYWLGNMRRHGYSPAEQQSVLGQPPRDAPASVVDSPLLPYPGGRHPRIGFLEGAINPMRGTKASVFTPWDPRSYLVIDLPEAIFSEGKLLFLAHTHVPTIWDEQNTVIENVDWSRDDGPSLRSHWRLPNGIEFGARIAHGDAVTMELWLKNGTPQVLTRLRTQVCVMLKGARDFSQQSNDNKRFAEPRAEVRAGSYRIVTEWERCGKAFGTRAWGNAACPCMHADPGFPDCPPGDTVRVSGRLWFEPA